MILIFTVFAGAHISEGYYKNSIMYIFLEKHHHDLHDATLNHQRVSSDYVIKDGNIRSLSSQLKGAVQLLLSDQHSYGTDQFSRGGAQVSTVNIMKISFGCINCAELAQNKINKFQNRRCILK